MDYYTLFNKIHCILRDGEVGLTGLVALNEINNMIFIIFNNNNLDEKYKFSSVFNTVVKKYILEKQKINKHEYLEKIIDIYCKTLESIFNNETTKKYVFSDTNKISSFHSINNQKIEDEAVYYGACKQVIDMYIASKEFFFGDDDVTDEKIKQVFAKINYDILGDAYEKFKEEEVGNQGKKTGQYFTPRCIIKYCINDLLKPKGDDLFYEPTCGTGGFIHFLSKYIHDNDKNKLAKFKKNIHGNDKTPELMKALYINLFLHDIPIDNIKNKNSLNKSNCTECFEKFDIIAGNPPYGVKNKIDPTEFIGIIESNKDINYFPKFMHSKKTELVKDSMGQFMIHVVNSLKIDGRFVLVIDRGILNNGSDSNSWQKELRKWLLNCCNIQVITLLPKGIFSSTTFDTAVIYGIKKISRVNSCKNIKEPSTKTVKIYDGEFEDVKNKRGLKVKKLLKELTIKDIINKEWSLKYDDYVEKKENLQAGIEYKALGEVCNFEYGKRITKTKDEVKDDNNDKKYPVYGGGGATFNTNKSNRKKGTLIISRFGVSPNCVRIVNENFFLNDSGMSLSYIDINEKFINNYLLLNQGSIYNNFAEGQAQKNMQTEKLFKKFKVPILSEVHQQEIVDCIEEVIKGDYKILDRLVSEFKDIDLFKFLLVKDYDTFKLALVYVMRIIDYENNVKPMYDIMKKGAFKTVKGDEKPLGKVCEIEIGGTPDTKNNGYWKDGTKLWVSISDLNNDIIKDTTRKITLEGVKNSNVKLIKKNSIMMSFKLTLGKMGIANEDMYCNEAISFFSNILIQKEYLWHVLKNYDFKTQKYLFNSQIGSSLNKKTLGKLPILIPSPEDQEKVVKMIESIEKDDSEYNNTIKSIKKMIENIYTNIEMRCLSEKITEKGDDYNESKNSSSDNISVKSTTKKIIYTKVNGVRCIIKDNKYFNAETNKLFATKNEDGELELVEEENEEDEDDEDNELNKLKKEFEEDIKPNKKGNIKVV